MTSRLPLRESGHYQIPPYDRIWPEVGMLGWQAAADLSMECVKQHSRIGQVRAVEPFGKLIVERRQDVPRFGSSRLIAAEAGEARCSTGAPITSRPGRGRLRGRGGSMPLPRHAQARRRSTGAPHELGIIRPRSCGIPSCCFAPTHPRRGQDRPQSGPSVCAPWREAEKIWLPHLGFRSL
jgi:hypothetical protein